VDWIAAEAEDADNTGFDGSEDEGDESSLAEQNPDAAAGCGMGAASGEYSDERDSESAESGGGFRYHDELYVCERERRIYRARTVTMLRRYMRYSIETGRLPSLLGREFFRAKVSSYTVVTFEDRVIFVHDMETCLAKLDEFSRQLIARHILQEHDRWATARLLHCSEKTVRRLTPLALDMLSEILVDVGLLERVESMPRKSCQGGLESELVVSDCEDGENKI
jgi:hypothetical protein